MSVNTESAESLRRENEELKVRLERSEEMLRAANAGNGSTKVFGEPAGTAAESRSFRSEALAQINEAVIATDSDRLVVYLNAAAEHQYGVTSEEALGLNLDQIFRIRWNHPDDRANAEDELRKTGFWRGENTHIRKDESEFLAESSISVRQHENTETCGQILIIRDITERKLTEYELQKRDERYRAFIEQSTEGIWRFEIEEPIPIDLPAGEQVELAYRYAYLAECNTAMARQYGYESAEALVGARLTELFVENDPKNDKILREFVESGYHIVEAETHERDINGNDKYFLNNFLGTVENGKLVRGWGTQRDITAAKISQKAFAHLAAIVESSDDAIISKDLDGVILSWNEGATRIFGYSAEEAIGSSITMLIPPDRLSEETEILNQIRAGNSIEHYETRRLRSDGTEIDISITVSPIRDNDGEIIGASKIARDITDQKFTRGVAERYHLLSMQARDIILFVDSKNSRIIEANQAAINAYGYDRETLLTMSIRDLRAPETLGALDQQYREADTRGIQFETIHQRSDGSKFPVEVSAVGSDVGGERIIVSTIRDITERQTAQEVLNHNQVMLSLAMQASRMGAWERDFATDIVWWSEELEEIFGLEKGGFKGTEEHFYELMHEDDRETAWSEVQRAVKEHRPYAIEFRFHHADGSVRWMEGRGEAVYSETGEPVRTYGIGIDITERKSAEEELVASEERYRLLTELSPQIVFMAHPEGLVAFVNQYTLEFTGRRTEDLLGDGWLSSIHPEHRERSFERWKTAVQSGGTYEDEFPLRRANGSYHTVFARALPVRNAFGKILYWIGNAFDVEARKQSERRLKLLSTISELIRATENPDELLFAVSTEVGKSLGAKRCLFNEIDLDNDREIVHRDYCANEVRSVSGTHKITEYSQLTTAEMIAGRTVVNRDSKADERTAADYDSVYGRNGERAYIAVPLLRESKWVASLWVSNDVPTDWSLEDVSLLETIAERTWTTIERLRMNRVLRESEENLRTLFNQAIGGIAETDLTGKFTTVNDRYCEIVGYSREELLTMRLQDITHEDDLPQNLELFRQLVEHGESFETERRYLRKDGTEVWVHNSVSLIKDPSGKPRATVTISVDITERRLLEASLSESEERFRGLIEQAPFSVQLLDTNGLTTSVNKAWEELWGAKIEQIPDYNVLEDPQLEAAGTTEMLRRAFAGEPVELPVIEYDPDRTIPNVSSHANAKRWVSAVAYPLKDPQGEVREVALVHQDVTYQKRAEDLITQQNKILEALALGSSLQDILELTINSIDDQLNGSRSSVLIAGEDGKRLFRASANSLPEAYNAAIDGLQIGEGVGSCGTAAFRRSTVAVADIANDPLWKNYRDLAAQHDLAACWSEPIISPDGRLRGTFATYFSTPRSPKPEELELLAAAARVAGIAIERKLTEERLRESEHRFRNMADHAPVMIWVTGVDGHCTYLSKSWYEFTGQTPETALGFGWIDVVHAEEREESRRVFVAANITRRPFELEHRLIRKDGEPRWVIDSAQPRFGRDGEFLGYIGSVVDITERKRAEERIRLSEERYRNLANAMPQLVWTAESDGTVDYYNSHSANYEGIEFDESAGTWNWSLTVHPDDLKSTEEAWANARRGDRYEHEHRIRMKDGTYRWHLSRAHFVKTPGDEGGGKWFGTATDIHDNKLAQEALVKAERRATDEYFQMLSRIVPVAQALGTARDLITIYRAVRGFIHSSMPCSAFFVSFYDAGTRLRKAAYAWGEHGEVDTTTLPPMELTEDGGPNSQAVFQRRSIIVDNYMDIMSTRPHVVVQQDGIDPRSSLAVPMIVMDRVTGTIEVQAYENHAFNQSHVIALEMIANLAAVAIENVRLLEIEARARSDAEAANRMKDEFLSVLSHELRTPLNAMLGWVRMLRAGILDEERSAKALEVIERNTRQQSSLIEDLLDVSRIISGKMRIEKELVDLRTMVKDVSESMRPLALNKGLHFNVGLGNEALFMNGDAMRLHQVVTNLIQNAIKFTAAGGTVEIEIANIGDKASIVVRDTGVGIDPKFLPNIFDRFSQADASTRRTYAGLGLGLTIVSTIVELHGGTINAASGGLEKGAVFTVTLPLAEEFYNNIGPAEAESEPAGAMLEGIRILLVDDDTESLIPLQIYLERKGAYVACESDAAGALARMAADEFDVLVSDIGMPETDGYELARSMRRMKGKHSEMAAIAVTAFASPEHRIQALDAGFDAHIAKPMDFEELLATIRNTHDQKK